ncbi:hypothetical protein JXM83_00360 [Candidatus Woesearchaeota archaeon]|nr:hypothetical protein [Candidatus Woesearchaeota archaeon]
MRNTTILSILVVLLLSLSACSLVNPLEIIKANPEVASFLAEHPNADIQMIKIDSDFVQEKIDEIRLLCGEQMQVKNYYQATIFDPDTNFRMVVYIDHETKDLDCLRKYSEITNETIDEEAKEYKEEFIEKEQDKEEKKIKEEYPETFSLKYEVTEDNRIKLSWDAVPEDENFQYYKVVRSKENKKLQYPEDGYIQVESNRLNTGYTDEKPLKEAYYRITAVYSDKKTNSNVIEIEVENIEDNENKEETEFKNDVELSYEVSDNSVKLFWTATKQEGNFQYYKIVRSAENKELQYPEDGYLEYLTDKLNTQYVDENPLPFAYYRITTVFDDGKFNSNVVKVYFGEEPETSVSVGVSDDLENATVENETDNVTENNETIDNNEDSEDNETISTENEEINQTE